MLSPRIATIACALCLAAPAAAGASPTATTQAKGPYGIAVAPRLPDAGTAKGPYGITPKASLPNAVNAKGPYGITTAPSVAAAPATAAKDRGATLGNTNGWQIVAISGAVLLAALGLGSVLLVARRRRVPQMGM